MVVIVWLLCFASCYLRWWRWVSGVCSRLREKWVGGEGQVTSFSTVRSQEKHSTQPLGLPVVHPFDLPSPAPPRITQAFGAYQRFASVADSKPNLSYVDCSLLGHTVPQDKEQIMTISQCLNTVYVFLTGPLSAPCRVWQHHSVPATSWDNPLQQTCWMLSRVSKETILHRWRHSHIFHNAYSRAFFQKFPCSLWSEWWRNTDHLVTENIWTTYNITRTHYPSSFLSQNILSLLYSRMPVCGTKCIFFT